MMPMDVMRLQMALAFGALDMQRRMVDAAWQMALWSMPGLSLPGVVVPAQANICAPAGRRKGRA